jgi:hypothetical protein
MGKGGTGEESLEPFRSPDSRVEPPEIHRWPDTLECAYKDYGVVVGDGPHPVSFIHEYTIGAEG